MDSVRAFVAIELDKVMRGALRDLQRDLRAACTREGIGIVRWVAPENIHLTLKFLGDVERGRLGALEAAVERAARASTPFVLTARGMGCFPDPRRPNTIWVGLEGQLREGKELARRLEDECAGAGFARDERGFTPHLTLGRVKREGERRARAAVGELVMGAPGVELGTVRAHEVCLIESDLRLSGPVYTVLYQARLGAE